MSMPDTRHAAGCTGRTQLYHLSDPMRMTVTISFTRSL